MIIWQGLGFLVAVVIFGCSLVANLIFNAKVGPGYYDHHKWPFAVSLLFSSAICWFLGERLQKRSDRIVIDKQTGKEFVLNQSRHALFFIPMHWWGPILLVGAVILFIVDLRAKP
jgi:hypothetical protein